MEDAHYIEWIALEAAGRLEIHYLKPGQAPTLSLIHISEVEVFRRAQRRIEQGAAAGSEGSVVKLLSLIHIFMGLLCVSAWRGACD